jgi:hypothetical protein
MTVVVVIDLAVSAVVIDLAVSVADLVVGTPMDMLH